MLRRKRVSLDSTDESAPRRGGRLRNALADFGWAVRERVFWRLGDGLRGAGERLRWPFERVAWALRRGLVWPAEDRVESWGPATRSLAFGAVVLLAAGAGVAGLLWAAPNRSVDQGPAVTVASAPVAEVIAPGPAPQPAAPAKPTLRGTAPIFKPTEHEDKAGSFKTPSTSAKSSTASPSSSTGTKPLPTVLSSKGPKSQASTSSSAAEKDGAVAGAEAVKVARRFAGAFVLYETGRGSKEVRETFSETATPELRRSLLRRPPRLPANVEVPKAKVLNVVPGPARGGVYPVSVSLLRAGLTSELRLDMEPGKGKRWQVTDVLG